MKRRIFSEEAKQSFLKNWRESGRTAAEFCKTNNIAKASLLRWDAKAAARKMTFQEVNVVDSNHCQGAESMPGVFATINLANVTIELKSGALQRDIINLLHAIKGCA